MKNYFLKINKKINKRKVKAFTLIELMMSVSIFSFLILLAVGSLFLAQSISVKVSGTQTVIDEVNLSIEMVTREMRYANSFHCVKYTDNDPYTYSDKAPLFDPQDCKNNDMGGTGIVFRRNNDSQNNDTRIGYYLDKKDSAIYKLSYVRNADNSISVTRLRVTSQNIKINNVSFFVSGSAPSNGSGSTDNDQPLVTILVSGSSIESTNKGNAILNIGTGKINHVQFNVQTSVSQRLAG